MIFLDTKAAVARRRSGICFLKNKKPSKKAFLHGENGIQPFTFHDER